MRRHIIIKASHSINNSSVCSKAYIQANDKETNITSGFLAQRRKNVGVCVYIMISWMFHRQVQPGFSISYSYWKPRLLGSLVTLPSRMPSPTWSMYTPVSGPSASARAPGGSKHTCRTSCCRRNCREAAARWAKTGALHGNTFHFTTRAFVRGIPSQRVSDAEIWFFIIINSRMLNK